MVSKPRAFKGVAGTKVTVFPVELGSSSTSAPTRFDTLQSMPEPTLHTFLDSSRFCLAWWLVLLSHGILGGYAFSVTALHWYLQNTEVSYAIDGAQVPQQAIQITAHSFFLVGVAHVIAVLRVVWSSIKAKELTFSSPAFPNAIVRRGTPRRSMRQCLSSAADRAAAIWEKIFGPTGFFGLQSPYFEVIFTIREASEILLQTYQAYYLSRSVPRPWINQLAVISIVLNCVASPFVHWFYKHNIAKRRLVNLLQDAVLDFCCSVMIPLSIVLPYEAVFDTETLSFPDELLMNDVWYVNAISEGRQVLVTSFLDFISTVWPHIGLFSCLMTVKNAIRRRNSKTHAAMNRLSVTMLSQDEQRTQSRSPSPLPPRHSPPDTSFGDEGMLSARKPPLAPPASPVLVRHWRQFFIHVCFLLWGCLVVALHLDAQLKKEEFVPGCKLHVDAWSASGFPCSVLVLNCHTQGIDGASTETAAVLTKLERSSLRMAVFSHCPALEIPPVFTEFPSIMGVEFFNCSLVDWPLSAAVHGAAHPRVRYIYIVLTNWTTFPEGLLHDQLPPSLTHLVIASNNMSELPDNIGDAWRTHQWLLLGLEGVPGLHEVPSSFCQLQAVFLELASTSITRFPTDCFIDMGVKQLVLSGSPVVDLPAHVDAGFSTLAAEHTAVSELPDWFAGWLGDSAYTKLHGSPVCNSTILHNGTEGWEILCEEDDGTAMGLYPWQIMIPQRIYEPTPQDN